MKIIKQLTVCEVNTLFPGAIDKLQSALVNPILSDLHFAIVKPDHGLCLAYAILPTGSAFHGHRDVEPEDYTLGYDEDDGWFEIS